MAAYNARRIPPSLRILLVDDSVLALNARQTLLADGGHFVEAVENPLVALERLAGEPFDLIVADYRMRKMNGLELIRQARAIQPGIRSMLLVTYSESLSLTETNAGVDYILQKSPHEVAHLTRAVSRLARLRVSRKPVRAEGANTRKSKIEPNHQAGS